MGPSSLYMLLGRGGYDGMLLFFGFIFLFPAVLLFIVSMTLFSFKKMFYAKGYLIAAGIWAALWAFIYGIEFFETLSR